MLKSLWIVTNYGKLLDGNTRPSSLSPEKPVCGSRRNRTLLGATDSFRIEKGVQQGCLLSSCLFNLYTEYIIRNASFDELQAGIKIGGKNNNRLRYADDTTLMAESEVGTKEPLDESEGGK